MQTLMRADRNWDSAKWEWGPSDDSRYLRTLHIESRSPIFIDMLTQTKAEDVLKSEGDRRREPRLLAEGEVTVLLRRQTGDLQFKAELLDFSLRGMRIRHEQQEFQENQKVHIFFSWGEVDTTVMWSKPLGEDRFETGLQLF